MFRIRLTLWRDDLRWVFRVGKGFRVVSLVSAAALLAAGAALGTFLVPLLLASLAVLGSLYEESATFDKQKNRVEFRLGLVFLHRTRAFPLDALAEVRLTTFGPARFVGLEVGLNDGRVFTIENDRGKASSERLQAWGHELARWLEVPIRS